MAGVGCSAHLVRYRERATQVRELVAADEPTESERQVGSMAGSLTVSAVHQMRWLVGFALGLIGAFVGV